MPIARLIVLVLLVAAPARPDGADVPSPLRHTPKDWIYLEHETIDTLAGAYHDKVSGVFVTVEADLVGRVVHPVGSGPNAREADVASGEAEGVPYRSEVVSVPGSECEKTRLSFLPKRAGAASWTFGARHCDELQRARSMKLILGYAKAIKEWPPSVDWHAEDARHVNREEIAALVIGVPWRDVRAKLGPSLQAEPGPDKGFMVEYELRQPKHVGSTAFTTLVFDKNQTLVEKRIPK